MAAARRSQRKNGSSRTLVLMATMRSSGNDSQDQTISRAHLRQEHSTSASDRPRFSRIHGVPTGAPQLFRDAETLAAGSADGGSALCWRGLNPKFRYLGGAMRPKGSPTTNLTTTLTTVAPTPTATPARKQAYRAWSGFSPSTGSVGVRGSSPARPTKPSPTKPHEEARQETVGWHILLAGSSSSARGLRLILSRAMHMMIQLARPAAI